MRKLLYLLTITILISTTSCSRYKDAKRLLYKAQTVLDASPDTALACLDSIILPEEYLSKEKYMEFLVAKTQAKYKTFRDIKDDTAVFEACRYYEKKADNLEMIAMANLYSGCVYEERNDFDKAMTAYSQAYSYAETINDSLLMWRIQQYIGHLYEIHFYFEQALDSYRMSAEKCGEVKERLAESYGAMGRTFILMKQNDSALFYIDKGIELSKQSNDKKQQSKLLQNLSIAYREMEMYDESKSSLKLAFSIDPDSLNTPMYYLNLSQLSYLCNEYDSLKYYANILEQQKNTVGNNQLFLANLYNIIYQYHLYEGNCDSAISCQQKYMDIIDQIYNERIKQSVYEVQKKYDYEVLQRSYNDSLIGKMRVITALSFILLGILAVLVVVATRLSGKRKEENALRKQMMELQQDNIILSEMKEQNKSEITMLNKRMSALEKENDKIFNGEDDLMSKNNASMETLLRDLEQANAQKEEINKSFENNLKQRLKTIRKISIFEQKNRNKYKGEIIDEIKEIAYGSSYKTNLEAAIDIFNDTYPNAGSFIRQNYGSLNDTEYNVCILTFLPLSVNDIADLLGQSVSTVGKARTNIRKKIGIEENGGDIRESLLSAIKNQ